MKRFLVSPVKSAQSDSRGKLSLPKTISCAAMCFSLLQAATPGAYADLMSASTYQANWVAPRQKSIFTSCQGPVSAKLTLNAHTFEDGKARTSGKLQISRKGKLFYSESFVSQKNKADIVKISGPRLFNVEGDSEPAILLQVQCYQTVDVLEYDYDAKTGRYNKRKPSTNSDDARAHGNKMKGVRVATAGNTKTTLHWDQELYNHGGSNWNLQIKRGRKVVWSRPLELPKISGDQGKTDLIPECFGPFVTATLDPSGKILVDTRVTRIVDDARLGCEMIYYYDRASRKMKVSTHEWGLNNPRLADLRGDPAHAQVDFVTEDWSLSQPEMGGPLQIWQWGKGNKLVNVTTQFPTEIKRHSRAALAEFKTEHSGSNLLGYIGDLCLLHQKTKALKELKRLNSDTETNDKIIAQLKAAKYF